MESEWKALNDMALGNNVVQGRKRRNYIGKGTYKEIGSFKNADVSFVNW